MRRDFIRCHGRVLVCTRRHAEPGPAAESGLLDDAHHVVWNGWAGEFWRRSMIALGR